MESTAKVSQRGFANALTRSSLSKFKPYLIFAKDNLSSFRTLILKGNRKFVHLVSLAKRKTNAFEVTEMTPRSIAPSKTTVVTSSMALVSEIMGSKQSKFRPWWRTIWSKPRLWLAPAKYRLKNLSL